MSYKLKLFSDKIYLPKGKRYIPLLYPFWGYLDENRWSIEHNRFAEYFYVGSTFFELVSPHEADVFVFPCEWSKEFTEVKAMAELAKLHGKKLLIFFNSDSDEEIEIENSIIFRTSFYKSSKKANEFALPGWSNDYLQVYSSGRIQLRNKNELPKIGYAGYTDKLFKRSNYIIRFLKIILRRNKVIHKGAYLRGKAVEILLNSDKVKANFKLRNLSGSAAMKIYPHQKVLLFREEYVRNIIDSDYTLVIRGGGNFSYRLYEVLSLGRIPIFINTDCVLPYDHLIDWKNFMVWIEEKDIDSIVLKINEFHKSLSNEQFKNLQIQARELFEKWISPTGFHSNIHKCIFY